METTTDAARATRSGTTRQSPETIWAPLARLSDAAAQAAATGAVAITRGFDRNSRRRAKALRESLRDRDVAAIEVTPAPGSERLLADTEIATVVNLIGDGSWQAYRLAAKWRAPVLTPYSGDSSRSAEVRRDVIGMTTDSEVRDVALSHVAVRPEDAATSSIAITFDGEPLSVPGGSITVTLGEQRLEIHLAGPDFAEQTFSAQQIGIETFDGPHRLVRDELPIAEFEGILTFTAEPGALIIRSL